MNPHTDPRLTPEASTWGYAGLLAVRCDMSRVIEEINGLARSDTLDRDDARRLARVRSAAVAVLNGAQQAMHMGRSAPVAPRLTLWTRIRRALRQL